VPDQEGGTACLKGYRVHGRRLAAARVTQCSDCVQQLHTVPNRDDAKLLQGIVREARNRSAAMVLKQLEVEPIHQPNDGFRRPFPAGGALDAAPV
jgi:hypothetical protein